MDFSKTRKKQPIEVSQQSQMTEEQWLDWRNEGIGGSDAAVALRVHPYKCPLDLYLEKIKGKRNKINTPATRWGHTLEPLVINMVQERFPEVARTVQPLPLMIDPDYPFLRATMDSGCFGSKGPGIIEAKTALSFHGGQMFKEGIPKHYRTQCLHYLLVSRLNFCILGALTEGYREEFFFVNSDPEELEQLQKAEIELWERMMNHDVFWLLEGSQKTSKALETLYSKSIQETEPIDGRGNEKAQSALDVYFESKLAESNGKKAKTEAENILKAMIGDSEEMICDHAIVKWSKTKRGRRFSVKVL